MRRRGSENKKEFAIAVETEGKKIGRIRMECINDCSAESLQSFVHATIEQKSTLITDGWKSYLGIEPEHYTHTVKAKRNEEDLLPSVHLCISLFKRWMLGIHQGGVQKNTFNSTWMNLSFVSTDENRNPVGWYSIGSLSKSYVARQLHIANLLLHQQCDELGLCGYADKQKYVNPYQRKFR